MGYYNRVWVCPYYRFDERGAVCCDGGRLALPGKETMSGYMSRYCCDVEGWRRCTIARALNLRYERMEENPAVGRRTRPEPGRGSMTGAGSPAACPGCGGRAGGRREPPG